MPETPFETDQPDFARHYLAGDLNDFYQLGAGEVEAALAAPREAPREALAAALERYARRLSAPKQVFAQLGRLAQPESRAVLTGQQAGLLLGPMYTLSKAASALALARRLDSEARPVVPVFWVASQDHDTAEVDHAYLLDLDERLARLELPLPADVPSGRIALEPAWLEHVAQEIRALAYPAAQRDEALALVRRAAEGAASYADLFAKLLLALFGPHGLVVLDPLEPEIAALFAPALRRELADPLASSWAITEAGERLKALGMAPQLGRAADATNLFLAEDGRRQLLRYDGGRFHGARRSYRREELEALLDEDPTRLTPAAGLRPVTQDAVLPTAVTVVGPGELRYFAQLKGVYERHGLAMPLVWPRASVTVLEPPVRRMLAKFDVSAAELLRDFEGARERAFLALHGHGRAFAEALAELEAKLERLTAEVRGIDPTLAGTVARAGEQFERTVAILRRKSARALAGRDDIYARQWRRLERHLLPLGQPQERVLSPFSFFLKFGLEPVVEALLALPPKGEHEIVF